MSYTFLIDFFHYEFLLCYEYLGLKAVVIQNLNQPPRRTEQNDQVGEGLITAGPSGRAGRKLVSPRTSAADPGSAVTAAPIVQGCKIMQKGTRVVHGHFTCLKQVGSLLLGFILYTN